MTATKDLNVLSRHSGMPLAGIQSGPVLDSGQNRAGWASVQLQVGHIFLFLGRENQVIEGGCA